MPPAHGGAVVDTILADALLRADWEAELAEMRDRINGLRARLVARSSAGLGGQLAAMGRFNSLKRLDGLACPTLVVCGSEDSVIPPSNSETLAQRLPDSRLLTLPGAGHFRWAHRTVEVCDELARFLESADARVEAGRQCSRPQ